MPKEEFTFEQPRSVFTTWLGIVLLFGFFALLVWAVMGIMPRGTAYEEKRAEARFEKLKTAREEWSKAQGGYTWADKEKGVVRLPVHRAMELAMNDLAQKKPAPANPLPPEGGKIGAQESAPLAPTPPPVAPAGPQPSDKPPATAITGKDSEAAGKAAAAVAPPDAQPGTQPGAGVTPSASAHPGTNQPQPGAGEPRATPVQEAPGTPAPVPGRTPR